MLSRHMKVILLDNVAKVGNKYEVKEVADGYALNFLIPQKLAEFATPAALARIEQMEEKLVADQAANLEEQVAQLKALDGKEVAFALAVNEKGGLFATLTPEEVLEAINEQFKGSFDASQLTCEPIKEVGEHEVELTAGDAKAKLKIVVSPETDQ